MIQMTLWELKKIIEHKVLWVVIILSILIAIVLPGPDDYTLKSLAVYKNYPGELSQYYDEFSKEASMIEAYIEECKLGKIKKSSTKCTYDEYKKFIDQKQIELHIYKNTMERIERTKSMSVANTSDYDFNQYEIGLKETDFGNKVITEKNNKIEELRQRDVVYAPYDDFITTYTVKFIYTITLIILCLAIGLIPVFLTDRQLKVNSLIGSTKFGRISIFSKVSASVLYTFVIFAVLYGIHIYRFGIQAGLGYYASNPLFNAKVSNINIGQFIVYYSLLAWIITLMIAFISLFISKVSSKFIVGFIGLFLYFLYPIIIDFLWFFKLDIKMTYVIKYINITSIIRYSKKILLYDDSTYYSLVDYIHWGSHVLIVHIVIVTLVFVYLIYYSLTKENIR